MDRTVRGLTTLLLCLTCAWGPSSALAQAAGDQAPQPTPLRLTLVEAVRMAFDANLDIAVFDHDRRIARENVRAAEGKFDLVLQVGTPGSQAMVGASGAGFGGGPVGVGGFGFFSTKSPATTAFVGADVIETKGFALQFNVGQVLPMGLRYDIIYLANRTETNSLFQSRNPQITNDFGFAITQPLLRGRGKAAGAAHLLVAQQNSEASEHAFHAQVQAVLLGVEAAYWELVFAERDLDVHEQSLRLAQEQLDRTRVQVEVGVVAPAEGTQAEVAVAERRAELIVARDKVDAATDQLRALLRADSLSSVWETPIETLDEPAVVVEQINEADALRLALMKRPELARRRAEIAARSVETKAAENGTLPRLDLVGSLSWTGLGGDLRVRDGLFGDTIAVIPSGYGDALSDLTSFDYPSWRVGINFSMPLQNRTAKATYARATLAEDRAVASLRRDEQATALDVRQSVRQVAAAAELVDARREARELATLQLQIEQQRFDVGMSTNFEVLRFQNDLARVSSAELRAIIGYQLVLAQYRRATGTLLESFGIELR